MFNVIPILLPHDADLPLPLYIVPFPLPASVSKAHPYTPIPLLCIPLGSCLGSPLLRLLGWPSVHTNDMITLLVQLSVIMCGRH